jgi:hypothetical protein
MDIKLSPATKINNRISKNSSVIDFLKQPNIVLPSNIVEILVRAIRF